MAYSGTRIATFGSKNEAVFVASRMARVWRSEYWFEVRPMLEEQYGHAKPQLRWTLWCDCQQQAAAAMGCAVTAIWRLMWAPTRDKVMRQFRQSRPRLIVQRKDWRPQEYQYQTCKP